jgi:hypothetical protein
VKTIHKERIYFAINKLYIIKGKIDFSTKTQMDLLYPAILEKASEPKPPDL